MSSDHIITVEEGIRKGSELSKSINDDYQQPLIDPEHQPDESHALTTFGAVLTVVSTMVGGGIVGLPFTFLQLGLWTSLGLMLFTTFQTINSTWLYLMVKDLIPGKPESLYEIGYMLLRRPSIFIISSILFLNSTGLVMVYFIVYGKTIVSVVRDLSELSSDNILLSRGFWVLVLAFLILPICLKKELQELHFVSLTLFIAILIFILIIFIQFLLFGNNTFTGGPENEIDFQEFQSPFDDTNIYKVIKSICCILVAFSFTINLFPLFSALKVKTNENCNKSVALSISLVGCIYTFLAINAVFLFGRTIDEEGSDIMGNVNKQPKDHWESFILRFLFIIVLACHIPFIFFSGKESLLIMVDEIDRRSISRTLEQRIEALGQQDKEINHQRFTNVMNNNNRNTNTQQQTFKDMVQPNKRITSQVASEMIRTSHQTNVRNTLQQNHRLSSNMRQASENNRQTGTKSFVKVITIMRETQSLRQETRIGDPENYEQGQVENKLAYKDMKNVNYYLCTLIMYSLIVTGAILIPSVDQILEIIATISVNALGFIFPSVFYFIARKKYAFDIEGYQNPNNYKISISQNRNMMISAVFQFVIGLLAFGFGMFNDIAGFIKPEH